MKSDVAPQSDDPDPTTTPVSIPPHEAFELGEEDVRAMIHLLGEIAEVQGDQAVKRRLLMERLAVMVDADIWMWSIVRMGVTDGQPASISMLHGGMTQKEFDRVVQGSTDPTLPPPEHPPIFEQLQYSASVTRQRTQLMSDEAWYSNGHVQRYRQGFVDHNLYHFRWTSEQHDVHSGIGFHRRWGREGFSPRDVKLVHILINEVHWLHQAAVPDSRGDGADRITPRQRAVLALLLQGRSRKEIAAGLEISPHTVGEHIDALYRHFNVDGRVSLMRRFMVGDGGDAA